MPLRILLAPFGSEGDLNPLLWLAEGLQERGHQVTFLLSPHYARLAESRGFAWVPVGTEESFLEFARDPRLWQAHKGPHFVVRGMFNSLPHFEEAFAQSGGAFDLVITSSFCLGVATIAEARGIPRLTVHLQPTCFLSEYECPVFLDELEWLSRAPRWVKRLFFTLLDKSFWLPMRGRLNAFRRKYHLPRLKDVYRQGLLGSPGAALFPEWFAPPQPDWPSDVRLFGFPLVPAEPKPLSPELESYLAAGPPPVVWTHGSANFDIDHFQQRALEASKALGMRCLLVSLHPPPESLPPGAFHTSHARFEDLFPRCRAIVHHGGIGTTSKAIAAGVPQLVIPRTHDQPDNAHRIVHLRLGKSLPYASLDAPKLTVTLKMLLDSEAIATRCRTYSAKMKAENGRPALCDWAESLATSASTAGCK